MSVIHGKHLTKFSVAADGATVSLGFASADGAHCALVLPAECLKPLVMTLPEMMRQSLSRRYQDPNLRLVYPVDSWDLEASTEPSRLILTLRTPDGFHVSFALLRDDIADIALTTEEADALNLLCGATRN
ncbi:MAG TPA: hypothetical protein VN802_15260 [Stellaceae bacterium]|nr:hypothetical protein [Stellaceae bacterium]